MMEITSRVHAANLVRWAAGRPDVLVLSADLTSSCEADAFRDAYPDRFISCGIAEQNMMSVAGGLCREGFVPFVHTFAVFICRRAFDQVAMSIAYPNLPVKMFGFLPGVTTPGGATHQSIDDVALMKSLPNMTVLEVGDSTEMESVLDLAYSINGPVYIRMLRGEVPRLFPAGEPMTAEGVRVMSSGDLTVFTSGICTEEAMRAAAVLRDRGVPLTHVHVSTHKPFCAKAIDPLIRNAEAGIITMENHLTEGGLGSAVAGRCAGMGIERRVVRLGIDDRYSHGAGRACLMREHGFDAMALIGAVERMVGRSFGITEGELAAARVEPVHSAAKAEAL